MSSCNFVGSTLSQNPISGAFEQFFGNRVRMRFYIKSRPDTFYLQSRPDAFENFL
jgi:hypothetical protein